MNERFKQLQQARNLLDEANALNCLDEYSAARERIAAARELIDNLPPSPKTFNTPAPCMRPHP